MGHVINITDKLSLENPVVRIGEKDYPVNDGMENMLKFQELMGNSTIENMEKAVEIALGHNAVEELCIRKMSISNYKVLGIAILAAMDKISYEEADARFRAKE